MIGDNIYYNRGGSTYMYNLKDKKETDLNANVSFNSTYRKAIARSGKKMQIIDIPRSPVSISQPIFTGNLRKLVNYREEWMQIYNESWRQMRDFFYAKICMEWIGKP